MDIHAFAFDRGAVPRIVLVNGATAPLGCTTQALCNALSTQVRFHLGPAWGVTCDLWVAPKVPPGCWGLILLDDADQAGALGYHDVTPEGLPQSLVFVATALADGVVPSTVASHELCEMLVDPACGLAAQLPDGDPRGQFVAYEVGDPVQDTSYAVGGVALSNFVLPSYFEPFRKPGSDRFDHLGALRAPFALTPGGYLAAFKGGQWTQVFGSERPPTRKVAHRTGGAVRLGR